MQHIVLRGDFVWRLPARVRMAALTFDDGPDPKFTPAVLDLLAKQGLKATFFLIGQQVALHPDLVRRIADGGHALGGHTYGHRVIVGLDEHELEAELAACRAAIADSCGVDSTLFRPPRGLVDLASMRRVARLGYRLVHWSRTYSDYRRDGTDPLVARMSQDPIRAGDIVLLHDNNPYTPAALERVLPGWRRNGVGFASL
jgi:peptidoglycan/xylan/chitin deacetylase (PgdA/CDA1 family)